jgi:VIT1/CCC1 family predicted Fe2+/Mn2+ transporter
MAYAYGGEQSGTKTGSSARGDSSTTTGAGDEQTLGHLVSAATRDLSSLVRSEIELAKLEVRADAKKAAKGGAMFGAAAFCGVLAIILLSIALAYGISALGIPLGWSFFIVAVLYLIVAAVLALIGKKAVSQVKPPERTIRTVKESVATLKNRGSS